MIWCRYYSSQVFFADNLDVGSAALQLRDMNITVTKLESVGNTTEGLYKLFQCP